MVASEPNLLIIDDDTIVRQSMVAYLEDCGFQVLEAADGQQGLAIFGRMQPDLVITDLKMPALDGLQVLKEIHQQAPDTPVIIMSGVGVVGDVVQSLRLGAADFLVKPLVDMEVLLLAINKSLETKALLLQNSLYREELESAYSELKDHVRTLEKDQEAGRQVQRRLLPPSPIERGGYRLEHRILPSLFLSGDFIDVAFRSDRFLSFYLADVSGHGASSAFTTIWLKHAASEIVYENALFCSEETIAEDLDVWLCEVNRQMLDTRLGHHMTCLLGVVDLQYSCLHYAVAGHLPLLVMVNDGHAEFLPGQGRPIGLFPDQSWEQKLVEFAKGSTLLAFSDGILEVMAGSDLIEKEAALLTQLARPFTGVSELVEHLGLSDMGEAPDDIAVLSLTRGGGN